MTLIPKHGRALHCRRNFPKQLGPLPGQTVLKLHKAGGVSARMSQAVDKPRADRIRNVNEDHGNAAREFEHGRNRDAAARNDDVGSEGDQLRRISLDALGVTPTVADFEAHIAVFDPAERLQSGIAAEFKRYGADFN